jgi:hypothetical protein
VSLDEVEIDEEKVAEPAVDNGADHPFLEDEDENVSNLIDAAGIRQGADRGNVVHWAVPARARRRWSSREASRTLG